MGTIRKTKGEFYYRKDGKTYKFLNQSVIENHFPNYSEPIHVEDDEVRTFSNGFLDFAALVSVDMMGQIVDELDKGEPMNSDKIKMMNSEEFVKKWQKDFKELDKGAPISPAAQKSIDAIKCMDEIMEGAKTPEWKTEYIKNNTLNPTEALFGFCGWLTARKESVIMGRYHEAAGIVEMIKEFCERNHLPEPRENWDKYLNTPGDGTYKYLEEEKQKKPDNSDPFQVENFKDALELAFLEGAYCIANRSGVKYIKEKFEQWYNSKYK